MRQPDEQFLQVADVVSPVVAAVVLEADTSTPWVEPVRDYLAYLHGGHTLAVGKAAQVSMAKHSSG